MIKFGKACAIQILEKENKDKGKEVVGVWCNIGIGCLHVY